MGFGVSELLIILLIVALLFGTKKLRNLGGDLGSALKSFRSAVKDSDETDQLPDTSKTAKNGQIIEGEVESDKDNADKS